MSLSIRRTQAAPWLKDGLWRKAQAAPSLDLRFADSKSLVDSVSGQNLITFTRASSATYTDSTGTLQTATTNAPRFDHNPATGESLGLLVEEQRTNSITNNTMVGAVAGTPGTNPTGWIYATAQNNGLTISIVGTGVENGINYIDYRFNGTTVASPNPCSISPVNATAATGQTWTFSNYWKLVGGATTGVNNWQIGIIEFTSSGSAFVTGAFYTQTAPTSAALITQRPTATRTLSGGATVGLVSNPFNFAVAGNTAIDFTIRIGMPQLEQGAFATSPIPTTTAAATRAADVATITGAAFSSWYRQDEGTVFAETQLQSIAAGSRTGFDINDNSINNRIVFRALTSSVADQIVIRSASSTVFTAANVSPASTTASRKSAVGYKVNDFMFTAIGSAGYTGTTGAVPVSVNQMLIGYEQGPTGQLGGTIRRLTYFPARLPNTTLQRLTQ
jgi:hypothetical protein